MRKWCIGFSTVLLVNNLQSMDGVEYLKENRWICSATVSTTNLAVKFSLGTFSVLQDNVWRPTSEYIANDEELILTPDKFTRFGERHSQVDFNPVIFKDQHKGFKITIMSIGIWEDRFPPITTYTVLSDVPMEKGEDDVEMILKNGEWVQYEKPQPVTPPEVGKGRAASPTLTKQDWPEVMPRRETGETPAPVVEVEPTQPSNLWLYALIPVCLLPILYFLRRKL